jgi:prolyl oligopeptidase
VTITDPYRCLEDQNSPETRAWINAQNEYSASVLGCNAKIKRLTQAIRA